MRRVPICVGFELIGAIMLALRYDRQANCKASSRATSSSSLGNGYGLFSTPWNLYRSERSPIGNSIPPFSFMFELVIRARDTFHIVVEISVDTRVWCALTELVYCMSER